MKSDNNVYYEAIKRLINNNPLVVNAGAKINNRNVALEAGRSPSSIRSDRPNMKPVIAAIEAAKNKHSKSNKQNLSKASINKTKRDLKISQAQLDIVHAKYLAVLDLLFENGLYQELNVQSSNVTQITETDRSTRPLLPFTDNR